MPRDRCWKRINSGLHGRSRGGQGTVLATDIDARFLDGLDRLTSGNVEVRQHDITRDLLSEEAS